MGAEARERDGGDLRMEIVVIVLSLVVIVCSALSIYWSHQTMKLLNERRRWPRSS